MSWDSSSILFDSHHIRGIIRLETNSLDISWADWNPLQNIYPNPKQLKCTSSINGILECKYDSNASGDFSTKADAPFCCQHRSPFCCNSKGAFNIDCPNDSHILFQKVVSQPSKTECISPPDSGGLPVCTTTSISNCYKACGKINCQTTCSMGHATARCLDNIQNPTPKCPSTCQSSNDCTKQSCFSNQGKCGFGDIWQSSGDLDNPNRGWLMCEFYYDFQNFNRSRQSELLRWMTDLYQYKTSTKPMLPFSFSIPLIIKSIACQSFQLFYQEIYSNTISPFSNIPFLSNPKDVETYRTNIINPILLGLQSTSIKSHINLSTLQSIISNQLILPDFSTSSESLLLRLPTNFVENTSITNSTITTYLSNFLREDNTIMFKITGDGTSSSQSLLPSKLLLKNMKIQKILTIDISESPLSSLNNSKSVQNIWEIFRNFLYSSSYIINMRSYEYSERHEIPSTSFILAYDILCQVEQYSPVFVAYLSSIHSTIPEEICKKMYMDSNVYPYQYALTFLDNEQKEEECRKQVRNDSISKTVNELGKRIYGYYSPDCKCIISNIAPVGQPQYNNKTSMCFDLNCNSTEMSERYNLTSESCSTPLVCQTVDSWGNLIQNSQNFDVEKYNALCQNKITSKIDPIVLFLGCLIIVLTVFILSSVKIRNYFLKYLFLGMTALSIGFLITLFAIEVKGTPTCQQKDTSLQTICQSPILGIQIPTLYCQDRYKWCQCLFNTDTCVCKSGILVPISGDVQIEKISKAGWNHVYGSFVIIIGMLIITSSFIMFKQRNITFWLFLFVIFICTCLSQYLCFTKYDVYKNNSKCS